MKNKFPKTVKTNKAPDFKFNPMELAQKTIEGDDFNPQAWDPKLEKDIYYAKNFFEFISSSEYLNITPFGKQVEMGAKLFEDYCPGCSDIRFLDGLFNESISEMQDRITWLEDGVCPKCKKNRLEWFNVINPDTGKPFFQGKNEMHVCAGQRSSKSTFTAMVAYYALHRYIQLPDPAQYFNQLANQTFTMAFVALTLKTATDNLWTSFRDTCLGSPWFRYYLDWANDIKKTTGNTLVVNNQTFLKINHKHLVCAPQASDSRRLRGSTRFFSSIDEIGFYDANLESTKVTLNARETRTSLLNSLSTIRNASAKKRKNGNFNVLDAYELNISSPSSANDPIMTLVKNAHKKPTALSFHFASWEMNPQLDEQVLRMEHINNPNFDRDFGAIPPLANSPFLDDEDLIIEMFGNHIQTNRIKLIHHKEPINDYNGLQWLELKDVNVDTKPRLITVDPGYSNNAFAISVSHVNVETNKLVIDWCYQVKPYTKAGCHFKINFPKFFDNFILPLAKKLNTVAVVYDRWNSLDQIQRLQDEGINGIQYSLTYKDFTHIIKKFISAKQILFPTIEMDFEALEPSTAILEDIVKDKPVLNMALQLLTVRDLGRRIVKPENGDDDLFRTLALAIWYIQSKEGKRCLGNLGKSSTSNEPRVLGVSRNRSVGSRSSYGNGQYIGENGRAIGSSTSRTFKY